MTTTTMKREWIRLKPVERSFLPLHQEGREEPGTLVLKGRRYPPLEHEE
jgi:hypothetical protein